MRLTPWEEERLLIFSAAELARRHRAAGLLLNGPEVVALICDAMLQAHLVVLVDPLGAAASDAPGAVVAGEGPEPGVAQDVVEVVVVSRSRRRIRVSSHYPFDRVNPRLEFDRSAAAGRRLDLEVGEWVGWEPGETRTVRLRPIRR